MGWATRWEPKGVCTTALARIAAATAMAGNARQTRSGLRLWRGERWRTQNRIGVFTTRKVVTRGRTVRSPAVTILSLASSLRRVQVK